MSSEPPKYPLLTAVLEHESRIHDPNEKLLDLWLNDSLRDFLLSQVTSVSRKRIRNPGDSDVPESDVVTDLADDMLIVEQDPTGHGIATENPPKRRLMDSSGNDYNFPRICLRPMLRMLVNTPAETEPVTIQPCTPIMMEPLAATPGATPSSVSESDDVSNLQQLVLPLPSASPVQTSSDKLTVHDAIERIMLQTPRTQKDLMDMLLGLGVFVLEPNLYHLVFQLMKHVPRTQLSTLCNTLNVSLRRDLLSLLPLELSLCVLLHLDHASVLAAAQVCRLWNKIVNNTALWCSLLRRDGLVADEDHLNRELGNSAKLLREWAFPSPFLTELNVAQVLYKKRNIIFRRWMDPLYMPTQLCVEGHGSNIVTCLQHDESKIITGIEGKLINVHLTQTGQLLRTLKGHDGGVWALKYFSNTLVSGSTDHDVRVWNIRTGRCTHVFRGHTSTVRCLDILHPVQIGVDDDGTPIMYPEHPLLVNGSRDHSLHVWRLPLDNEQEGADSITETKAYDARDPDNPYLVHVLLGHTLSVRSVTGYGNIIISGSYDTTVRVWDLLDHGRCKHVLVGHSDRIYSTALNYKSRRCYSGSMDSSINVWDYEKGKLLYSLEGHSSLVGLLELSDKYLVSAAADSTLRVWDPKTGENLSKLKGHNSAITCFQHDSLRIVSGSERMLKLWDIKTGRFVRDLLSDITGGIWQVSFDPDRCVAAVQKQRNDEEETYIVILDFSKPLYSN